MLKQFKSEIFLAAIIFVAMFIFFSQVHPIVLYDGDDWNNISDGRTALPKWGSWNPAKVLPEMLLPICGYISAFVVMPIVGDYLRAFTITAALILSGFITAYVLLAVLLLENKFSLGKLPASLLGLIFLLLHFAAFLQHNVQDNLYLFHTRDATCVFHYLIPDLLNAALVLLFAQSDVRRIFSEVTWLSVTLFLTIYLAIFSNILTSSILALSISIELLIKCLRWKDGKIKGNFLSIFSSDKLSTSIIFFWLISLLFESSGGNAKFVRADGEFSIIGAVTSTAAEFAKSFTDHNQLLPMMLIVLLTLPLMLKSNARSFLAVIGKFTLCLPLWIAYTVSVTSYAGVGYIIRRDVQFGLCFYLLIILLTALAYLFKRFPCAVYLLPILTLALLTWIYSGKRNFSASTYGNVPEAICLELDRQIMGRIIAADRAGLTEVTITVPKGDDNDNWPHPLYMGENISRTLCNHGIISRRLKVIVVPNE